MLRRIFPLMEIRKKIRESTLLSSFFSLCLRIQYAVRSRLAIRRVLKILFERLPPEYQSQILDSRWHEQRSRHEIVTLLESFAQGRSILSTHRFGYIFDPAVTVSFIYSFYGKQDTILRSIESIKSQVWTDSKRVPTEIIVIDDGSGDTSVSKLLPEDVIYVWRNKFRYGISRCRNLGAKIANGRFLVFLDPDLILNPNYVESMLAQFHEFGERAVLTGYLKDYHYEGCEDPRVPFGVWEKPNRPTNRFLHVAGGNVAVHRDVFAEVGGFDEDLIYGGVEDTIFGYLVGKLEGTSVVYSTGMTVNHIPHPPGLAYEDYEKRSWQIVAAKYPEAFDLIYTEGFR